MKSLAWPPDATVCEAENVPPARGSLAVVHEAIASCVDELQVVDDVRDRVDIAETKPNWAFFITPRKIATRTLTWVGSLTPVQRRVTPSKTTSERRSCWEARARIISMSNFGSRGSPVCRSPS